MPGSQEWRLSRLERLIEEALAASGGSTVINNPVVPDDPFQVGELDISKGPLTTVGYALTSTTGDALDLNQDLVIPCSPGDDMLGTFSITVTAATGMVLWDVLSVFSGNFFGDGITGPGWPEMQCPAAGTARRNQSIWYQIAPNDVVDGNALFRIMYRLSVGGGSPVALANDTDGHFRFRLRNGRSSIIVAGQNTGALPVTPPSIGGFTDETVTSSVNVTTATATFSSATFTPTAGDKVSLLALVHLTGVNAATVNLNTTPPTDTFGDTAGTAWSLRSSLTVAAPNAANSNSFWYWTRTIGTTPGSGHAVITRNAGSHQQDIYLWVGKFASVNEAPSQVPTAQGNNVSQLSAPMTTPTTTSAVLTWMMNCTQVATATTPTLPTEAGTWTPILQTVGDDAGWAIAILPAGPGGTSVTWPTFTDTAISLMGVAVIDASGSPTSAPGVETWTHADKTTDINADQTWVGMTV